MSRTTVVCSLFLLIAASCSSGPTSAPTTPPPVGTEATASDVPAPAGGVVLVLDGKRVAITADTTLGPDGADVTTRTAPGCKYSSRVAIKRNDQGAWFLEDLESNGFGFKDMKMDNKVIEEGDEFELCSDRLAFTYR
jgi:hypothetical protein